MDVGRVVGRGWRYVVACTAIGAAVALAVVLFAPRRFENSTSLIVRAGTGTDGSLLSRITGGGLGGLLSSASSSQLATESAILESRAIAGQVVDSLRLQAQVRDPAGLPSTALVRAAQLPGSFDPLKLSFDREGTSYRVTGKGWSGTAVPGTPIRLPVGSITLADHELPQHFELLLLDREDAVTAFGNRLTVKQGKDEGEVVRVSYRAPDSVTAAAVPNLVAAVYLARRHTTDRGINEHRLEFLTAQMDSVGSQLAASENALRRGQERTGVLDATVAGKLQLEQAGELRKSLGELDVEAGALDQMLAQIRSGHMTQRQLAAYPSFLKSPAINSLLAQQVELETERNRLLEYLTDRDPSVVAVTRSIENVQGQLLPLATAYAQSLAKQRADVRGQLDTLQAAIATLPAKAETGARLQRDVLRLGQIYAALQAQTVEARLAAISEGGDVRQLDMAVVPKHPSFPKPVLTMGLGVTGGLALGLLAALLVGVLGRWVDEPQDVTRVVGVPALRFDPAAPLLMAARAARTLLVVPLQSGVATSRVAQRLAETALARGKSATVLDLSDWSPQESGLNVGETITRLEQENDLVIVRLPGLAADATGAAVLETRPVLLVAPERRVDRTRLRSAIDTLRRLEIPCAGVVLDAVEGGGREPHVVRAS